MNTEKRNLIKGSICVLTGATLWGFSGVCGQFLFTNYEIDVLWLTTVRMISSGLLLLLFALRIEREGMKRIWEDKRDVISLVAFAVGGLMFCQLAYLKAIEYSNAGTATILQYIGPVLIMIFACAVAKRLPTKKETVAIVLAVLGTFILATHGNIHSMVITEKGLVWGLLAALGLMFYNIIPTSIMAKWGTVVVSTYGMLMGGVAMGLIGRVWNSEVDLDAAGILATAAICLFGTVAAFTLYLYGVKVVGPVKASMMASAEPVAAVVIMVIWLNSPFAFPDAIGFLCIFVTVFLLVKGEKE